jgi:hypothetical protein
MQYLKSEQFNSFRQEIFEMRCGGRVFIEFGETNPNLHKFFNNAGEMREDAESDVMSSQEIDDIFSKWLYRESWEIPPKHREEEIVLQNYNSIYKETPVILKEWCDHFITPLGFNPLTNEWSEVDRKTAIWILRQCLGFGLAYGGEKMSRENATKYAEQFIDITTIGNQSRGFFTNGQCIDGPTMCDIWGNRFLGYSCLTDLLVDTGVLVIGKALTGILWVAEDD